MARSDQGAERFDEELPEPVLLIPAHLAAAGVGSPGAGACRRRPAACLPGSAGGRVSAELLPDFRSSHGHFSSTMQAEMARVYSMLLSGRLERALLHNFEQGLHNGPCPLGYQRDDQGVLQPTGDAPTVDLAFQLYETRRYIFDTLVDELPDRGLRSRNWRTGEPTPFSREQVQYMLRNRTYLGEVGHKGEWRPGRHQQLVSTLQAQAQPRGGAASAHHEGQRGAPSIASI